MKLTVTVDLGEVEIETDSGTGRIDGVWIANKNYADSTAEELILALLGQMDWSKAIAKEEERQLDFERYGDGY
jgi:hypothetical protein